eukprot:CAMPEP_0201656648 /NCGR_PEP_ID=MMETSP0494-20130426/38_1 /ASSEMBLY_ACC=CAM_ASM_000839 /TAXON_ID=420259 /ORGANISM="Thalassiosira gravida, Strain GMp14c1" /LENGTH=170 /DNA_ID=CAMNT_0048133273 /DNA_START=223 /DNA_END=736 /DNA_ORIENTATION=+
MTINITRIKFFIRIIRQRLNQLSHNAVRNSIVTKSIPDPVAIAVAPFVSLVGTLAAGAGEVSSAVHGGGGQHAPVSEPVAIAAAPDGALSLGTPGAGAGDVSSAVHGVDEIGGVSDENNSPLEDNMASVDGTRRATATAKNFMLNYSREESRWMMFGERGLNGLCDVMTV